MFKAIVLLSLVAVAYGAPQFILMDPHKTEGMKTYKSSGAVVPEDTASVKAKKAEHMMYKDMAKKMKKMVLYSMPGMTGMTGYAGTPIMNNLGYTFPTTHLLGKREAEADSDAQYIRAGLISPFISTYQSMYGSWPYSHMVAKREADADADADSQFISSGLISPYMSTYQSVYGSWPYNHMLGKREAEADADSQYYLSAYNRGIYGNAGIFGFPYIRSLGKREAEAEPEADSQYLVPTRPLVTYNRGIYGNVGYRYLWKREAEADSQYLYNGYSNIFGTYPGYNRFYY